MLNAKFNKGGRIQVFIELQRKKKKEMVKKNTIGEVSRFNLKCRN